MTAASFFKQYMAPFLPGLIGGIFIFLVPPAGIAIILAYFAAPVVNFTYRILRLPRTISTLVAMLVIISAAAGISMMAVHGLMDTLPIAERHLEPYTGNQDWSGVAITFLKENVLTAGHTLVEHTLTFTGVLFQQVFTLFIFLVAFFFALRETGKDRFWFLVYFPSSMRRQAHRLFKKSGELIGHFISIEARLVCLTFLLLCIGFFLLGFSSPIGTAFLISLADSLPFLGIGLFLFPMILFYFYTGNYIFGSALLLLYILTLVTRQIAESYLWASTFRVKPVHAFLITASSFYLFGLPGILLTPFLLFTAMKIRNHPKFIE
ncbi:AI-2E family transporter [Sporosarcina jeotgali]|uniref:AI-2E family transporter n=1 Tax=Sporosarcina jeotgali TaxID=3020056 RepID=A0ABZ0KV66_9BACL|nr:AI-2E family transporter [Sporosarcina sp. B2O-1]WOV83202.1 AI-2E family transporter [Sporosarcina sp. B2O-1]